MILTWNLDQWLNLTTVTKQCQNNWRWRHVKKWRDAIVIFSIYGQFGAIRKPDSGLIVCITYIFMNSNVFSYENWKQN